MLWLGLLTSILKFSRSEGVKTAEKSFFATFGLRAKKSKVSRRSMSFQRCSGMFTRRSSWARRTGNPLRLRRESCIHGTRPRPTSSIRHSSRAWRASYLSRDRLKVHVFCSTWEIPSQRITFLQPDRSREIHRQVKLQILPTCGRNKLRINYHDEIL